MEVVQGSCRTDYDRIAVLLSVCDIRDGAEHANKTFIG